MKLTKKQYITYGSIAFLLGTITYLIIRRKQKQKMADDISKMIEGSLAEKGSGQTIISEKEVAQLPDGVWPLAYGTKSKKGVALQKALNNAYGLKIPVDGKLGITTANAICKYYKTLCTTGADSLTVKATFPVSYQTYNEILNTKP